MRILLVEDEQQLRDNLSLQLRHAGYAVDVVEDGERAVFNGTENPYDLAIVDIGLPGMSGIDVIKVWRQSAKNFPILILTARSRWQDKVTGLEAGGDDYLVKPFQFEELLARVQALLRRSNGFSSADIHCGPVHINMSTQTVSVENITIQLTAYEYNILEYFLLRRGEVISKTVLTEHIYDQDFDRDSNVIEVLVGRLRRKLEQHSPRKLIETLRGRGYRFSDGGDEN